MSVIIDVLCQSDSGPKHKNSFILNTWALKDGERDREEKPKRRKELLGVEFLEGVGEDGHVALDDVGQLAHLTRRLDHLHAFCVRVIVHRKGPRERLGKCTVRRFEQNDSEREKER